MNDWKTRLRQAREAKGLNKTRFAREVGVSNPTVSDWEKSTDAGGIKEIAGTNLTKVCTVLGIDPHWLLHGGNGNQSGRVGQEQSAPSAPEPTTPTQGRTAEALGLKAETAAELRLLSVYRLAGEDGRAAIDIVVEKIRRRLQDSDFAGLHQR